MEDIRKEDEITLSLDLSDGVELHQTHAGGAPEKRQLTLKLAEKVEIIFPGANNRVVVYLKEVRRRYVRLSFTAPFNMKIFRAELLDESERKKSHLK